MTQKLALVTGSNKGIGHAICKALALRYSGSHFARSTATTAAPSSSQGPTPLLILCTARNPSLGTAAVEKLREEIEAKDSSALKNGLTELRFEQLDVNDEQSRMRMKGVIDELGGLDLLINNAGIMPPGTLDASIASSVLQTNYFGLRALTTLLTPLLNPGARVVNVSSTLGMLSGNSYSESLKERFRQAASDGKPELVDELMHDFVHGAQDGTLAKKGWTTENSAAASLAYNVSKSGLSALTQALHNQHTVQQGKQIQWSSCCPGYVKTDLTRGGGFLTVEQGARTPVKLALDDIKDGPQGGFWRNEKPAEWM